jgi:hypothetical protein
MAEMEKNSQTRKKQRASRSPTIAVAIGVVAALAAAALNPAQMEVNAAQMEAILRSVSSHSVFLLFIYLYVKARELSFFYFTCNYPGVIFITPKMY